MKMKMQDSLQELKAVRDEASALKARAASENRDMTAAENTAYNAKAGRALCLEDSIREVRGSNTLVTGLGGDFTKLISGSNFDGALAERGATLIDGSPRQKHVLSMDYRAAFTEYMQSNGTKISAALYEGSNPAGGFTVPVVVEGQVVPLAPTDMGVRAIASVIPTSMRHQNSTGHHHQYGSG